MTDLPLTRTTPHKQSGPTILMVDDDVAILNGFRRNLGRRFNLTCANGAEEALALIKEKPPFAVIVTDMRMPDMDGLQFILSAREAEKSRDSIYMMLTGNADQNTADNAIEQGQIYRFLNKPCEREQLESALIAAIEMYQRNAAGGADNGTDAASDVAA